MKSSITDHAEGKMHQAKGKVKEIVGKAVGNRGLESKGKDENFVGKAQEKLGQVKKVIGK